MQNTLRQIIQRVLLYSVLLLGLSGGIGVWAEEQSVSPGINEYYQHPDVGLWRQRFESPGREVFDMAEDIVDALHLKPGMRVADIGAGTGLFTRRFATRVGDKGKVYAVDISQGFIQHIRRQAAQSGLKNIEAIVNTPRSTLLPTAGIDLAFVCDTYHHFEYPAAMLYSLYQALKENGRLAIIDFRKDPDISSPWVMKHVRADQHRVRQEIEAAGFRYVKDEGFMQNNYFMIFVK